VAEIERQGRFIFQGKRRTDAVEREMQVRSLAVEALMED
jgi:hypothetical protein